MQSLLTYLSPERCIDVVGQRKDEVLLELAKALVNDSIHECAETLYDELIDRERVMSTGIGIGLAVPHTRCPETDTFTIAIGRSASGVPFDAVDGKPVKLFFAVVAPGSDRKEYLKLLARIVMRCKDREFFQSLLDAPSPKDMYEIIAQDAKAE